MKNIKFRAFDKEAKEMSKPFEFDSSTSVDFKKWTISKLDLDCPRIILMQFTGRLDKLGKEVYEDDIIEAIDMADGYASTMYPYRGVVKYNEKECCFEVVCKLTGYDNTYHSISFEKIFDRSRGEVIGNIHQDPDLESKT